MWDFLLIDLQDVVATKERSYFPETDLHNLANLIVAIKGLMRPVILKKIGFERFQIIEGNLEYYACLIAKEKERSLETINAFVVDKEAENIALQQIQLLSPSPGLITTPEKTDNPLELRVNNLEKRLETQLQAIREEYQKEIKRLEEKIIISPPPSASPPPSPPSKSILELLNTCDANQLKKAGINRTVTGNFLKVRKDKLFISLDDITDRVDKMGAATLIKLMDYLLTYN
ncbi:MAG: chromosome partitioning protein ParB [Microcystis sp. M54BS1]|uniref:chromosome partitioning protein ParB n=1 Tax=unclassified Microcystis TaxID=2643300 RepID=UPI00257D2CBB|nr:MULTISPECIES: chromosome partitioning protein ParB [unclassified Microcystis]MCA2539233.1 chromosome partitioning protein ParB [Microcystis sp. M54BS1]MCA2596231.1 chromosome partitioning protein ParB [Microcystis sp. M38BS1]MCA2609978.1 chromosome partitioning protein ParB [Microcystis sp. M27BS1]MCA2507477.1 chromosome partitioning protein ParB [Microcystis sp. M62BS1]MCA2513012.1 chromosome partitioning protein ParB [Microcystis sp. M60BS1]